MVQTSNTQNSIILPKNWMEFDEETQFFSTKTQFFRVKTQFFRAETQFLTTFLVVQSQKAPKKRAWFIGWRGWTGRRCVAFIAYITIQSHAINKSRTISKDTVPAYGDKRKNNIASTGHRNNGGQDFFRFEEQIRLLRNFFGYSGHQHISDNLNWKQNIACMLIIIIVPASFG